jgi:signal transduction histidine kinase
MSKYDANDLKGFMKMELLLVVSTLVLLILSVFLSLLLIRGRKREKNLLEMLQKEREELEKVRKEGGEALIRFHNAVSHGIRMPISIILGYADLLRGNLITDEDIRMEYLQKICERISYMSCLFDQFITDARADNNLYKLITAPIDIAALVKQTANDVSTAASRKGINIRVTEADEPIILDADATQLTKVFYNILENSMKYMGRKGEINITVSRSSGSVLIVFKDDGKGLAEEEIEHIFDSDYQGKNKKSGNGLGLHLAKLSISAHGGEIFAKSGIDKGMGIYICIPEGRL